MGRFVNSLRLKRLLCPKWTVATFLIAIGWCCAVIWANTTPRLRTLNDGGRTDLIPFCVDEYGYPWTCLSKWTAGTRSDPDTNSVYSLERWALAGDLAVGVAAVIVLTSISQYLLNRMVSACRFGKVESE